MDDQYNRIDQEDEISPVRNTVIPKGHHSDRGGRRYLSGFDNGIRCLHHALRNKKPLKSGRCKKTALRRWEVAKSVALLYALKRSKVSGTRAFGDSLRRVQQPEFRHSMPRLKVQLAALNRAIKPSDMNAPVWK